MTTVAELKQAAIAAIETRKDEIKDIAHQVLNNPATGFTERKTASLVKKHFDALGISYQDSLAITGIKGKVAGGAGGGATGGATGGAGAAGGASDP